MIWKGGAYPLPKVLTHISTTDVEYTLIVHVFLIRRVGISAPSFIRVTVLLSIVACLRPVLPKHWVDSVSKLVQSGDSARF